MAIQEKTRILGIARLFFPLSKVVTASCFQELDIIDV